MKYVKIKEVAEVVSGSTPKTNIDEYWNGEYNWITPKEINENSKYIFDTERRITKEGAESCSLKELKKNTVLLTSRAPIGKVALVGKNMYCNQGFKNLVCNEQVINPEYMYYWLKSQNQYLNSLGRGATFKEISKKIVEDIEIPIQDIETQNKIVEVLDKAQDLIDKKIEQIDLLDELVKSRFIEMFGNPVSNLKGWKKMTLNDISMKKGEYGSGESAVEYKENYPRYIRITDIDDNGKLNNSKMTVNNLDEYEKYKLNDGDILFARTGATVGKTFLYKEVYGKCLFAGYLIRFIPNKDIISPEFLFAFTKTDFYKSWIKSKQNVVAQPNINAKQYGSLEIPIPPIKLQNEFAAFVEKVNSVRAAAEKSLQQLNDNFNSLMQKAFKGELF